MTDEMKPAAARKLGPVTLACGDDDVRLSWAESGAVRGAPEHTLHFARCSAQGCSSQTAKVAGISVTRRVSGVGSTAEPSRYPVESPYVLDLGEKAALLWESSAAVYGRVGPKDGLDRAPDQVIVEMYRPWVTKRELPGAAAIAMQDSSVVVRGDAAIALLPERVTDIQTSYPRESMFPVRLSADGSIRALPCDGGP